MVLLATHIRSPEQVAADAAAPTASVITVPAERRSLVEDVVLRCSIVPGSSVKLAPPVGGTGDSSVVTAVAARTGERVGESRLLFDVSGSPVFALALPFPLYRDLHAGDTGPDVRAVQQALRRANRSVAVTGTIDPPTERAVDRLYTRLHYPPPHESASTPPGSPAVVHTVLRRSAVLTVDRADRVITVIHARVGAVLLDPAAPLIELDGEPPTLRAVTSRDQAQLLAPGQSSTVFDDLTGKTGSATIVEVGQEPVADGSGNTGLPIRLSFTGPPLAVSGDRTLRVQVAGAGSRDAVLAVPDTAINSSADGATYVLVLRDGTGDRGQTVRVPVATGRRAGGWVEVSPSGSGLTTGSAVVVGEGAG